MGNSYQRESIRKKAGDFSIKVQLRFVKSGEVNTYSLYDMSRSGLGVICFNKNEFTQDEELEVLKIRDNALEDPIKARVALVKKGSEKNAIYVVGIEFLLLDEDRTAKEENRSFVKRQVARANRFEEGESLQVRLTEDENLTLEIYDISRKGLSFIVIESHMFNVGDEVEFNKIRNNNFSPAQKAVVRNVTQLAEDTYFYRVGVEFI